MESQQPKTEETSALVQDESVQSNDQNNISADVSRRQTELDSNPMTTRKPTDESNNSQVPLQIKSDPDVSAPLTVNTSAAGATGGQAAAPNSPVVKPAYETLTTLQKRSIMISVGVSLFLAALDQMIVIVSLPKIMAEFQHPELLSWVVSAYMLASSAVLALYGRFSDVYGRKQVFLFALASFMIGSAVSGSAISIWMLIGGRAVQGVGGGGLMAISVIVIGDIAYPKDRPKYLAIFGSMFGIASVLGPIIGGLFTDHVTWRWVFYINLPLGAVAFIVIVFTMVYTNVTKKLQLDVLGSILVAIAAATFVLFISWGGQAGGYPWDSGVIIGLIVASFVFAVLFVIQESRHPLPILNLRLFYQWNFTCIVVVMCLAGFILFGAFTFLPVYFQDVKGDSAIVSGLKTLPNVLGILTASALGGITLTKTGKVREILIFGSCSLAVGMGLLILIDETVSYGVLFVAMFFVGIGLGCIFPTTTVAIQNSVPHADMANAMSSLRFFQNLGGAVGVSVFGALLNMWERDNIVISHNPKHGICIGLQGIYAVGCGLTILPIIFSSVVRPVAMPAHKPKAAAAATAAAGEGAPAIAGKEDIEMQQPAFHMAEM